MKLSASQITLAAAVVVLLATCGRMSEPGTRGAAAALTTAPLTSTPSTGEHLIASPPPASRPHSTTALPIDDRSPSPAPSATSKQPLALTSIHMINETAGWATDQEKRLVFRTTDGGTQWRNVSPLGIAPTTATATFFLDPDNAWVAVAPISTTISGPNPTTVTVFRSHDGGQMWQPGIPFSLPGGGPGWLDFVDPQHGWLMADLGVAAGSQAIAIFKTSDGGLHWQQVSLTAGEDGQSSPGSLPAGCDKTGITFLDSSTGWATGDCAGGDPFFYVTHDGGATWQAQPLPPPPNEPALAPCMCSLIPPMFVSPNHGFLLGSMFLPQHNALVYVTSDGGKTWKLASVLEQARVGTPDFLDAHTGWFIGRIWSPQGAADATQLYVTHDGARSWAAIRSNMSIGGVTVTFVTDQIGWFVDGSLLFKTTDGGATWQRITPVLIDRGG